MEPLQRRLGRCIRRASPALVAASVALAAVAPPSPARAAPTPAPSAANAREAGKHFQRGVSLFNEADYNAALIEFKRAYELAPNPHVLYNVGQTNFQLQNYAAAIVAFEAYLSEAPQPTHRAEVETALETLRTRVGRLEIASDVAGAEVAIDDQPVGRTPFAKPLIVSVGRRKVVATAEGRAPITRYVEVASGEGQPLALTFAATAPSPAPPPAPALAPAAEAGPKGGGTNWGTVALVSTGVLAAGTLAVGTLAFLADRDAVDKRDTYPVERSALRDAQGRARSFALATDLLGAATLVAGGAALYLTLTHKDEPRKAQVGAGPGSLTLRLRF
ncbi:MAG TPA: PEGA domain-containing protein [Polyangiaceae bacterium]|nr:PEGA domain-containing protein [Polyangiaceae bacterium]